MFSISEVLYHPITCCRDVGLCPATMTRPRRGAGVCFVTTVLFNMAAGLRLAMVGGRVRVSCPCCFSNGCGYMLCVGSCLVVGRVLVDAGLALVVFVLSVFVCCSRQWLRQCIVSCCACSARMMLMMMSLQYSRLFRT